MVYDGNNAPYDEDSNCIPVNFYGSTKLKADEFFTCLRRFYSDNFKLYYNIWKGWK